MAEQLNQTGAAQLLDVPEGTVGWNADGHPINAAGEKLSDATKKDFNPATAPAGLDMTPQ